MAEVAATPRRLGPSRSQPVIQFRFLPSLRVGPPRNSTRPGASPIRHCRHLAWAVIRVRSRSRVRPAGPTLDRYRLFWQRQRTVGSGPDRPSDCPGNSAYTTSGPARAWEQPRWHALPSQFGVHAVECPRRLRRSRFRAPRCRYRVRTELAVDREGTHLHLPFAPDRDWSVHALANESAAVLIRQISRGLFRAGHLDNF